MTPVEFAKQIPGWMTPEQLAWLSKTASGLKPGAVWLEVGTWMGRSWSCVALSLPIRPRLIAVDTFDGGSDPSSLPSKFVERENRGVLTDFARTVEEVRKLRPGLTPEIIICPSPLAATLVPARSCDVIFLDGDHREIVVGDEIPLWKTRVKPGGLLSGHDANFPGVRAALEKSGLDYTLEGNIWWHRA